MSQPWFKLYGNMPRHPKSYALEMELGDPMAWAYVVKLWCWASQVVPSGNLAKVSREIIAREAGWTGEAAKFVAALCAAGWMDAGQQLHGWADEQAAYAAKKARDREAAKRRYQVKAGKAPQQEAKPTTEILAARNAREKSETLAVSLRETGREIDIDKKREEEIRKEKKRESPDPEASTLSQVGMEPDPPEELIRGAPPNDHPVPLQKRQRGVIGLAERAERPSSPAEMAEKAGAALLARFPAYDGRNGRPTIRERIDALWQNFIDNYDSYGPDTARSKLIGWLGDGNYQRLHRAWEIEVARQGSDQAPPEQTQHPQWPVFCRLKREHGDGPPWEEFRARVDGGDTPESLFARRGSGGAPRNGTPKAVGLFVPKAFDYDDAAEGLEEAKAQLAAFAGKSARATGGEVRDAAE